MDIPQYPKFTPIRLNMLETLAPWFRELKSSISEFTFSSIYLFRNTYNYEISRLPDKNFAISGTKNGEGFIMLPGKIPDDDELLLDILSRHIYIKNANRQTADEQRIRLEKMGCCIIEDRDNWDYLYLKKELAELPGKKFHKKRNLVRQFLNNYEYVEKKIDEKNIEDAFSILECWNREKNEGTDYPAAKEALELKDTLGLCGYLYYVDNQAAAYVLGEPVCGGKCFVVHFEKACGIYKGIYQFINKAFASILPGKYIWINREQDLGDPGLRQAKMTYRPSDFVKKYRIYTDPSCPCPQD